METEERRLARDSKYVLGLLLGMAMVNWGAEWLTESRAIHLGVVSMGCVIGFYSIYRIWKAYLPYHRAKRKLETGT